MPTFSFELYPPRSPQAEVSLFRAIDRLSAVDPEFISVTYRPTGPDRAASLAVLGKLIREHRVHAMAHLTCVGATYDHTAQVIREFLDEGVTSFLALRGDPPEGQTEEDVFLGDFTAASELVELINRVQSERDLSNQNALVAVATFPNGHPRSSSRSQDIDTLLAKEAAGANLAITQLFFRAEEYLGFVADARAAGVTIRILPGIMPVLSASSMRRVIELSGERPPTELVAALDSAPDATTAAAVGTEAATLLAQDLLAGGADGIHLYTFNRSDAPLAVLRGAGLLDPSHQLA